jgi:uncharacterized protein (TIGR02246 family)
MKKSMLIAVGAMAIAAGCHKAEVPAANSVGDVTMLTEAEAGKVFESTVAAWQSMDAATIKALYAPDVVGFDYSGGRLVTDRATWDKNQDAFAAAKLDKVAVESKTIQILGPDSFVVSSYSVGTSSAKPGPKTVFRCTDIYQREADDSWLITNENCSGDGAVS